MDDIEHRHRLWSRPLRYLLTETTWTESPRTTAELVGATGRAGFRVDGRPSKVVADALRWEVAKGRVVRLGRARYGPGAMPRQTRAWRRARLAALRDAPPCTLEVEAATLLPPSGPSGPAGSTAA